MSGIWAVLLSGILGFSSLTIAEELEFCRSSREYITVLEFLRQKQKNFGLEERQSQKIAMKVADGCTGAAKQFVKVLTVMSSAEVGTREALQLAVDYSSKSPEHVDVFLAVFKRAYLKKYLDLDLTTSVKIAKSLTLEYKGDVKNAGRDFERVVEFCLDEKKLGLPLGQCAETSAEVSTNGEHWPKGVSDQFIRAYTFLRSGSGVGMVVGEALAMAAEIVSQGPYSVENFIDAYKYGTSKKGLSLAAKDSVSFARGLLAKTMKGNPSKIDRQTASQE